MVRRRAATTRTTRAMRRRRRSSRGRRRSRAAISRSASLGDLCPDRRADRDVLHHARGRAGKDAYAPIKRWGAELLAARRGDGSAVIQDNEGTRLVLDSRLPDEALAALSD